jgi:hypothetical protein
VLSIERMGHIKLAVRFRIFVRGVPSKMALRLNGRARFNVIYFQLAWFERDEKGEKALLQIEQEVKAKKT